MKIIIFGAAGTGKTTLGKAISNNLKWTFLDSDEYYWEKSNPPFQKKIPLELRNQKLKNDFEKQEYVIVSGSLCTWSSYWDTAFDLGVFLRVPKESRMERLLKREIERYGGELETNEVLKQKSKDFLFWAEKYDDEKNDGHSIRQHMDWIKVMDCTVIELIGDHSELQTREIVISKIKKKIEG